MTITYILCKRVPFVLCEVNIISFTTLQQVKIESIVFVSIMSTGLKSEILTSEVPPLIRLSSLLV